MAVANKGSKYLAFTIDTDKELARIRFVAKYGEEPKEVIEGKNVLLLGPVPKDRL